MEKTDKGRVYRVLCEVPPEQWATSPDVSRSLLECPRVHNMAKNALFRNKVKDTYLEEVVADAAFIMQSVCIAGGMSEAGRQKGKLEKIDDVYFIIYQTVENVVRNYKKKRAKTTSTLEHEISSYIEENEGDDAFLERVMTGSADGGFEEVERHMDLEFAQKRLKSKIEKLGWPDFIPKDRPMGPGRPSLVDKQRAAEKPTH